MTYNQMTMPRTYAPAPKRSGTEFELVSQHQHMDQPDNLPFFRRTQTHPRSVNVTHSPQLYLPKLSPLCPDPSLLNLEHECHYH